MHKFETSMEKQPLGFWLQMTIIALQVADSKLDGKQ